MISKPDWLLRFATHLHRIRPLTVGHEAAAIAAERFDESSDITPEEAAELYASMEAPEHPGAPE
ncbi:MAG: hypothetical protein ABI702_10795 [Burkholderiales bacterium]